MGEGDEAKADAGETANVPAPPPTLLERSSKLWRDVVARKVAQWSAAYIVLAFGLLQGLSFVRATLGWSVSVDRVALALLASGLPIVITFAWHHGDLGRQRVTRMEGGLIAAFAALGAVLAMFAAQEPNALPQQSASNLPRLAVLRFESLGDTEPYFSEGLADELISEISRVRGIEVTARASSFALSGENATPAAAARELGATLVLTGSARRTGDVIRVHAQLAEARSGRQLWDQTFERPTPELYSLQRDIAVEVARAAGLRARVGAGPPRRVDADALALYLRARQLWYRRGAPDIAEARTLLRAAVSHDREFAEAWSWLSYIEFDQIEEELANSGRPPTERAFAPAMIAADRALVLDSSLSLPYRTRECVYADLGRWREAFAAGDASEARGDLAWASRLQLGYTRLLVEGARRFTTLDPFNHTALVNLSIACMDAGDVSCARETARRALDLAPSSGRAASHLVFVLRQTNDLPEARRILSSYPEAWREVEEETRIARRDFFLRLIGDGPAPTTAEILESAQAKPQDLYNAIWALAVLGRLEDATSLLSRWGERERPQLNLTYAAELAPLRRTSEFWALMEREGLLAYWRQSGRWPDFCERERGSCDPYQR